MYEKPRLLIVDDDSSLVETTADVLATQGFEVTVAESGSQALAAAAQGGFQLALVDMVMPQMDGVETVKGLKKLSPQTRVLMMTGYSGEDLVQEALRWGASGVVPKPLDPRGMTRVL